MSELAGRVVSLPARSAVSKTRLAAFAAGLFILACAPFLIGGYHLFQLSMVLIYAISLLGLNLLTGYSGQISLGQGAFYAIGAYTTAILLGHTGLPYGIVLALAAVVCLVAGYLFGLPALRLDGHHLALATFALAVAVPQVLKFRKTEKWTGGIQGVVVTPPDVPFGLPLEADQWLYFVCLAVALAAFAFAYNLINSRVGNALIAIRDNPIAAASMGIDTAFYKSAIFGVSAAYTGLAGALSALVVQFVSPDSFTMFLSISLMVGSVVGGISSISGAVFGAIFILFIPNFAEQISKAAPWAVYGALLIGFMWFMPMGITGALEAMIRRIKATSAKRSG